MPRPHLTPLKDPVPILQEAGWASGPVWTGAANLAPTGIRSPDRPARRQSLYRLRYPAAFLLYQTQQNDYYRCTFWHQVMPTLSVHQRSFDRYDQTLRECKAFAAMQFRSLRRSAVQVGSWLPMFVENISDLSSMVQQGTAHPRAILRGTRFVSVTCRLRKDTNQN